MQLFTSRTGLYTTKLLYLLNYTAVSTRVWISEPEPCEIEKPIFQAPSLQKYTDMEEMLALDPIHEVDEEMGWPSAKVAV